MHTADPSTRDHRGRMRRSAALAAIALAALASPLALPSAQAAPTTSAGSAPARLCDGLVATIIGHSGQKLISGTRADDVILGTSGDDVIKGNGGNDTICGHDGSDRINGGSGADWVDGGSGNDRINGGAGKDRLFGSTGRDVLRGRQGADVLTGGPDADRLVGGAGRDILDGEFDDVVRDTPPAPQYTFSFAYTSSITIPEATTRTIHSGCPAGWYVRPGQPNVWDTSSVNAFFTYKDDGPVFHESSGDGVSGDYPTPKISMPLFQNLYVSFYNSSLLHHEDASITFWCDKVPDWYTNQPSTAVRDIGPVNPGCYYCSFNDQLTNLKTGFALDPSNGAAGNPVLVQDRSGSSSQNWYLQGSSGGSAFIGGLATFGLWKDDTLLKTAIAQNGSAYTWASASDEPPANGRFYLVDQGAGGIYAGAMLVNTTTNECLASPDSANTPVVAVLCDATDQSQWWKVSDAV